MSVGAPVDAEGNEGGAQRLRRFRDDGDGISESRLCLLLVATAKAIKQVG